MKMGNHHYLLTGATSTPCLGFEPRPNCAHHPTNHPAMCAEVKSSLTVEMFQELTADREYLIL